MRRHYVASTSVRRHLHAIYLLGKNVGKTVRLNENCSFNSRYYGNNNYPGSNSSVNNQQFHDQQYSNNQQCYDQQCSNSQQCYNQQCYDDDKQYYDSKQQRRYLCKYSFSYWFVSFFVLNSLISTSHHELRHVYRTKTLISRCTLCFVIWAFYYNEQ